LAAGRGNLKLGARFRKDLARQWNALRERSVRKTSLWTPGGRELFYVAPDNTLMASELKITGDSVRPSATRALFTLPIIDNGWSPYDTIDGQRFLVRAVSLQASPPLTVIVNWPALLKKGPAAS
jgi:hypothetical protein